MHWFTYSTESLFKFVKMNAFLYLGVGVGQFASIGKNLPFSPNTLGLVWAMDAVLCQFSIGMNQHSKSGNEAFVFECRSGKSSCIKRVLRKAITSLEPSDEKKTGGSLACEQAAEQRL